MLLGSVLGLLAVCCAAAAPLPKQHYTALRAGPAGAAAGAAGAPPDLAQLPPPPLPPLRRTDTERLLGAEYTPSGASNELWLAFYPLYRAQVQRDLASARRRLAATTLRVFLHSLLWEADAAGLLANVDDLLGLAAAEGMQLGLVFFDSCWNASGASLAAPCEPTPGVHNSCWMQSPQAADRTSVARYEPYVSGVVRRFAADDRVAWFEIYNEPDTRDAFVVALRAAGYAWARAQAPRAPVLSCWDYDTPGLSDVSDVHAYSTDFAAWSAAAFAAPARGALFSEAGCRSFQAPFAGDAGSPLVVLHYLGVLRARRDAGLDPYVPGAMLAWEVAVGNSNTRWHWGSAAGAPEPAIPWCGLLFPDGTPVSHTEAAALRRYATGADELLFYTHFFPPPSANGTALPAGAPELARPAGQAWWAPADALGQGDVLVEASLWPARGASGAPTGAIELVLRAANASAAAGGGGGGGGAPCNVSVLPNTNACPGARGESNFVVPPGAPDAAGACAAACCAAGAACSAWVFLPAMGFDDGACACARAPCACCWLKPPGCAGTAPLAGCTTGLRPPPPPPPPPPALGGYIVALNSSASPPALTLARAAPGGGAPALLGAFDLASLDNGVVDGWSLLRVVLRRSGAIDVYLNVALRDTGFEGNAGDATRVPHAPAPRIAAVDPAPLGGSGLAIVARGAPARVEYVGVLPASVL